jgi:acetyltransferase
VPRWTVRNPVHVQLPTEQLFSPRSVAVAGASPKPHSVGGSIVRNLIAGGFAGPVSIVHPRRESIDGLPAFASIAELPEAPDVIVLATPAATIPDLVHEAGAKGIASAIIITAGLGRGPGSLAEATDKAARKFGIRLIGPNCLGILAPAANSTQVSRHECRSPAISRSFHSRVRRRGHGRMGGPPHVGLFRNRLDRRPTRCRFRRPARFLCHGWAHARNSALCRIDPRCAQVHVGGTRSGASEARRGRQSGTSRTRRPGGGNAYRCIGGADAVYDAAFRRAGLLRAYDLDELFDAAETLGSVQPFPGDRLAILTNGGGIGVLAVDRLADLGGTLSGIAPETSAKLDAALPATWSKSNPIDIIGDADEERYAIALEALLEDAENDAILAMNVPTTLASPARSQRGSRRSSKPGVPRQAPAEARLRELDRRRRKHSGDLQRRRNPALRFRGRRHPRLYASC